MMTMMWSFHLMIMTPMLLMILHQEAKKKKIDLIEAFWIYMRHCFCCDQTRLVFSVSLVRRRSKSSYWSSLGS